MKKLVLTLFVLGVLGAGGWYAYRTWLIPPERRACDRLAELCSDSKRELERCEERLGKLGDVAGEEAMKNASTCMQKAESCMGALGCVAGAGLSGLGQFLEGVVDGFDPKLKEKGRKIIIRMKDTEGLKKKGKEALRELMKTLEDVSEKEK